MAVPAGKGGRVMQPLHPYCRVCSKAFLPAGPRHGEGHLSVRFGRDDQRHFSVFEGDVKLLTAYEVQAGPGGWVIEIARNLPCDNCGTYGLMVRLRFSDDLRVMRDIPALVDQRQEGP